MSSVEETTLCVEVDGCCHTHSPCFDYIAAALEGVDVPPRICEGWPCPRPQDPPQADR